MCVYLHVFAQMQSKLFSLQKPLISSEIVSAVIAANMQISFLLKYPPLFP